jgi:uridylate kinase
MSNNAKSRYKRIILKLSGEALRGEREYGSGGITIRNGIN